MSAGARTLVERIDSGKPPSAGEAFAIMQAKVEAAQGGKAKGG